MGEMFSLDFISDQEMSRVELTERELVTSGLLNGDLLFGRRSVVESGAGRCSLVVEPPEPLTFESSIIRVRLNQDAAIPLFFYYFFRSPAGRFLVGQITSGTNVKGIRGSELRNLSVPLPSLPEQRAVAAALSDVDALIGALDKLIAKKRDLKQAAMQQLLTGKRRLPGFDKASAGYKQTEAGVTPEAWEVNQLSDIASLERGKFSARPRNDPRFFGGKVPFIQTGDITNSNGIVTSFSQTLNPEGLRVSKLFPSNTLFFTIAANIGDVGIAQFETACTDSLVAISPKPKVEKQWLFHALRSRKKEFEALATKNAQLNINLEKLRPYSLAVPPPAEQHAIATVLSDMDAEITALEKELDKTLLLKQGMIQELLTGRTRLV